MNEFGGSSALDRLNVIDQPVGTLEEIQQANLDPDRVGCCAPHSPGVRGCNHWKDCPFHLTKFGGFKGRGPKNVGYYLKTHEGAKKEDFITCFGFINTLLARMRAGNAAREKGERHEVIRIVAQEGEKIVVKRNKHLDPNNNRTGDIRMKIWHEQIEVPKFPRITENPRITYSQELDARERLREQAEDFVPERLALDIINDPELDEGKGLAVPVEKPRA